jgi:hypothetical protein
VIRVPDKSEEVIIHDAEVSGPTDSQGRSVLKPLEREEFTMSPAMIVGCVGGVIVTIIATLILGSVFKGQTIPLWLLSLGAVMLAPPIALAGYSFLRNDELEPYRGTELAIRIAICAAVYAILWGIYGATKHYLLNDHIEMFHFTFVGPVLLAIGGGTALACLDLDFGNGALHYAFYLLVSVLLRYLIGAGWY